MNEKELTLKEIQNSLLEIMKVFDAFCRENDLQYFLSGGTLLGAVRHHGFIPWDDDVDVMMPRPDYDRLISLLKGKKIVDRYELRGYEADNSYLPFLKLCDTTIKVEEEMNDTSDNLWIDVFPLDPVPDDEQLSKNLLDKARKLKYSISLAHTPLFTGSSFIKKILKTPLVIYHRCINGSDNDYSKKMLKLCRSVEYDTSNYVAGIAWSTGPQERMKKSELYPVQKMSFCGAQFSVGHNYRQYLESMYGDYMTIPKDKKTHHIKATIEMK